MQPDISKIEEHLDTIAGIIHPARTLKKCGVSDLHMWAKIKILNPLESKRTELMVVGANDPKITPTAHEKIEFEILNKKASEAGHAIRVELQKCPLLNYKKLTFGAQFYRPSGDDFPVSIYFDGIGLGSDKSSTRQVCDHLAAHLEALGRIPSEALKGPMRAFSINDQPNIKHYAPSPEALIFKRKIRGHQTHSISECLDLEAIQTRLETMPAA